MLPHLHCEDDEISDTTYGETDSQLKGRATVEAQLLKHFWKREYLTSLREFHKTKGNNVQKIKVVDIVLMHDDIPKVNWKLAVIQQVIKWEDGVIRAANICTANGVTNCPITKLYPLEVTASGVKSFSDTNSDFVTGSVSKISPQLTTSEQVNT